MHGQYMRRAIELAEKGRGRTSPNPLVGAVIVKDGAIVGEGFHTRAGEPHAEINALNEAQEEAKGATMYITLEPCCIYGRTSPCTEAIIESGISRVIVGLIDPNPKVCGRGIEQLKLKGIDVEVGILSQEIAHQNEIYIKYITTGLPFVLMKVAMSMDGKITAKRGSATRITSEKSRKEVHRLRGEYDSIMVGIGTVLLDNPLLTVRLQGGETHNPIRIIIDSKARIPLDSKIVKTASEIPTILAVANADEEKIQTLRQYGVEVLPVPRKDGRVDLVKLMKELGEREITSVLLEGGSLLSASAIKAGIVDKFLFFIAPKLIGGDDTPGVIGGESIEAIDQAPNLKITDVKRVGEDLMIEAYPKKGVSLEGVSLEG
ncbi:MAG: bifunctional diaminohydroxyphosphoribosylaminopyrimidine deaminase/5-amino-6-(5-phosphoribosylamino)uracil reductase RibD [Actinomycetota bacterium]|nr:bifunctional diaminohydroxyphosphoribosylaminopyrimidine deaminase/5-amino-6-(5-phosphoribosylamino)uracil reductase RibD [Actinomycetota bacterium]